MPKYTYQCSICDFIQEKRHGMFETYEYCPNCQSEGNLAKIPSVVRVFDPKTEATQTKKVGEEVTSFIEDAREMIKQEKERLREDYKPT
jgi:hypothetical protein